MTDNAAHLRTHPHDAAARFAYCDFLAERGADHRRGRWRDRYPPTATVTSAGPSPNS